MNEYNPMNRNRVRWCSYYPLKTELSRLYHNLESHVGVAAVLFEERDRKVPHLSSVCDCQSVLERNPNVSLFASEHDVPCAHTPLLFCVSMDLKTEFQSKQDELIFTSCASFQPPSLRVCIYLGSCFSLNK